MGAAATGGTRSAFPDAARRTHPDFPPPSRRCHHCRRPSQRDYDAATMPSPHPNRRREPDSPPRTAVASRGAFSDSTERARRADLAVFRAWCATRGATDLPDDPGTLAAFVDDTAAARAPATVRRYVASVAAAHRTAGLPCPAGSAVVGFALGRMDRHRGRRQKQARGLTWAIRERLLAAAGDRLIDARNRALVAVA